MKRIVIIGSWMIGLALWGCGGTGSGQSSGTTSSTTSGSSTGSGGGQGGDGGLGGGGSAGSGGQGGQGGSAGSGGQGGQGGMAGSGGQGGMAGSGGQGGQGGMTGISCNTPNECPGADTTCAQRTCEGGLCGVLNANKGTPCSDGSGTLCSGAGQCVPWASLSTSGAPSPRYGHSAVWTGTHMIIWGGATGPGQATDSGYRYDPATDTWTPISTQGAPEPRRGHAAIWTGTHMLIWGGFGTAAYAANGGRYDPATDTWSPMSTANQPSPRTKFSAVWDDNHQYWLVWGGLFNASVLGNGSRYDPATDTWTPIANAGAPSQRLSHMAAWVPPQLPHTPNGTMVIFGGSNTFNWLLNGALLDPVTNSWTPINMQPGANLGGAPPSTPLEGSATLSLSDSLVIWGGWDGGSYYGDGYSLFPNDKPGGFWYGVPQNGAPSARSAMIALSPGFAGMFVWGGCSGQGCGTVFDDGGLWTFGANGGTWESIGADPALTARTETAAVSTGTEAIIWGGRMGTLNLLGDGARRVINPP